MNLLFWISFIFFIVVAIMNIVQRKWFSATTYIFVGITIPMIMYFFEWSDYIKD